MSRRTLPHRQEQRWPALPAGLLVLALSAGLWLLFWVVVLWVTGGPA